jgi:hypothetical protein
MKNLKTLALIFTLIQVAFSPSVLPAEEIYQYTNAAGRTVYSSRPTSGQKNESVNKYPDDTRQSTHQFCREKWDNNFEMIEYCMKNQRDARMKLHRYPADILQFCKNKWQDNYEMIEHCAKNQYAAKKRIGQ